MPRLTEQEQQEKWMGDYVFENELQSFRTGKEFSLELTSRPRMSTRSA